MEIQNPWWVTQEDIFFKDWNTKKIKWKPSIVNSICLNPFSLHFITGPRQVGKTTSLKLLIHRLLNEKWDPFAIFYYQCDLILDYKELDEIITNYLETRNARKISSSIIILDEITFVKDWWRSIKARIDQNTFTNDVVIISGSASIELLKEKERFPGRRGNGQDYIQFPLSFQEYCALFIPNLKIIRLNSKQTIEEIIAPNKVFRSQIDQLFSKYLITGGFPSAINDFFSKGEIQPETKRTYIDWIVGDVQKSNRNMNYMKEVLNYIIRSRLSPVSWLSMSKETSLSSPHTSQDYVDILKMLYVVQILHQISSSSTILYRKNKKLHLLDPFLTKILAEYTNNQSLDEQLVESIVVTHFNRYFPTYYYVEQTEVDLIAIIDNELIGFEVKWGPKTWKKPLNIKKVFLLTQDIIPLFLASINWS